MWLKVLKHCDFNIIIINCYGVFFQRFEISSDTRLWQPENMPNCRVRQIGRLGVKDRARQDRPGFNWKIFVSSGVRFSGPEKPGALPSPKWFMTPRSKLLCLNYLTYANKTTKAKIREGELLRGLFRPFRIFLFFDYGADSWKLKKSCYIFTK